MSVAIRSGAALLCALLWAGTAAGQAPVGPVSPPRQLGPRITILAIGSEDLGLQPLRKAISAHLSAYGVTVEILVAPPEQAGAPVAEIAARALAERDAMAVVWVDEAQGLFSALIADAITGNQTLTRTLPGGRDAWVGSCDGLASTLHAALIPNLRVGGDLPPSARQASDELEPPPDPRGDEEAKPEEPPREIVGDLAVLANLGYGPVILNSHGEVQHGARSAIGLAFRRGFEAIVGLDLLFPYEAGSEAAGSGDVRLVRWPLRIAAGWSFAVEKLHVGARLGLVVDFTQIRGWEAPDRPDVMSSDETKRTNPGLMAAVRIRIDLVKWFSFCLDVTGDWFSHAYNYEIGDVTIIQYGAIQIGFVAGISVQFDVL
jgi:hypothetical protein